MWDAPVVYGCVPEARDGHTACVINSKMYIFAGYDEIVSNLFLSDYNILEKDKRSESFKTKYFLIQANTSLTAKDCLSKKRKM